MRSPSTQIRPPSMVSSWLMQRRKVVLPEPEGPSRTDDLAAVHVHVDALEHLVAAGRT
jgi:hypothetical protein